MQNDAWIGPNIRDLIRSDSKMLPRVTCTNHSPCRTAWGFRRESLPIPSFYK